VKLNEANVPNVLFANYLVQLLAVPTNAVLNHTIFIVPKLTILSLQVALRKELSYIEFSAPMNINRNILVTALALMSRMP
jgi:hypothetical protein